MLLCVGVCCVDEKRVCTIRGKRLPLRNKRNLFFCLSVCAKQRPHACRRTNTHTHTHSNTHTDENIRDTGAADTFVAYTTLTDRDGEGGKCRGTELEGQAGEHTAE